MKLKKFDALNATSVRKGKSSVSFNPSGTIGISGIACQAVGLKEGDRVCFFKDEETDADWYLAIDCDDGFKVRVNTKGGKGCSFNSVTITARVLEDLSWTDEKAAVCRIVTEPISVKGGGKLFPILISSARKPEF